MVLGKTPRSRWGLTASELLGSEQEKGWEKDSREEGCTEVVPRSCSSPKPVFPVPLPAAPRPPTRCLTSRHKKQLERKRIKRMEWAINPGLQPVPREDLQTRRATERL